VLPAAAADGVGHLLRYGRESSGSGKKAVKTALGIFYDKKFLAGGSVRLALPQDVDAPDRIFRRGTSTGAPAHLLGSPTCRRNFRGASAGQFLAPSVNFRAVRVLRDILGPPLEMLLCASRDNTHRVKRRRRNGFRSRNGRELGFPPRDSQTLCFLG
jgi:hypothetical protein